MECDAGPPPGSVAERVFALARGDLLRQEGRDADGEGSPWIHVGRALGIAEFSCLDRATGARSAKKSRNREQLIATPATNTCRWGPRQEPVGTEIWDKIAEVRRNPIGNSKTANAAGQLLLIFPVALFALGDPVYGCGDALLTCLGAFGIDDPLNIFSAATGAESGKCGGRFFVLA